MSCALPVDGPPSVEQLQAPPLGAAGVVSTIACRNPSRPPWRTEIQSLNANPKSMIPKISARRNGSVKAVSTRTAPRSERHRGFADPFSDRPRIRLIAPHKLQSGPNLRNDAPMVHQHLHRHFGGILEDMRRREPATRGRPETTASPAA